MYLLLLGNGLDHSRNIQYKTIYLTPDYHLHIELSFCQIDQGWIPTSIYEAFSIPEWKETTLDESKHLKKMVHGWSLLFLLERK